MTDTPTREVISSVEHVDSTTGLKSVNSRMVGTTDSNGNPVGAVVVTNGGNFTPSSVGSTSFTMDNTNTHSEAIGTGVIKLQVVNTGVTTEAIYVGFGTTEAEAKIALAFSTDHATNGHYIPSPVDAPSVSPVINVPASAIGGAYAVCNAAAGDTQDVIVSQGV